MILLIISGHFSEHWNSNQHKVSLCVNVNEKNAVSNIYSCVSYFLRVINILYTFQDFISSGVCVCLCAHLRQNSLTYGIWKNYIYYFRRTVKSKVKTYKNINYPQYFLIIFYEKKIWKSLTLNIFFYARKNKWDHFGTSIFRETYIWV